MQRRSMAIVLFTIAVDAFGFGISLPLTPELLGNPASPLYMLSAATPASTAYLLIGLLGATYPIMQFFSTPVLGQLSDRYGRKPVLAASLAGTAAGYVLFAIGVAAKSVPLLFASRAIDGLTGGNISVAHAVIADVTAPEERTKAFGLAMGMFGAAMIIGPVLGGVLADASLSSWFTAKTPFLVAAALAALNTVSIWTFFAETRKPDSSAPLQLVRNLKNLAGAYARPKLRRIFGAQFFVMTGNALFITFFGVFLIDRFAFSQHEIARFFGYTGACMIFTQFVTLRRMAKRFSEPKVLRVTIIGTSVMVAAYLVIPSAWWIIPIAPLVSTCNGLTLVNLQGLLSRTAGAEAQGEALGIGQSISALAMAFPPLLAGTIATVLAPAGIVLAAALAHAVAWSVFVAAGRGGED
jgi:predicted MFS family arabinose efflux permease